MRVKLSLFIVLLSVCISSYARTYSIEQIPNVQKVDASRYTSNPDGILSEQAVAAIDRACDSLHTANRAQIAVVAVEDIEGGDVFTFAFDLFSAWGVGGQKSDNGLGILLVTARREIRFVTGYGLEGVLTDALCKRIQQQYMVSHLSAGEYSTGMVEGVAAVARVISGSEELLFEDEADDEFVLFMAVFFGFILLLIAIILVAAWMGRKCPKCGKHELVRVSSETLHSTRQYNLMLHTYRCKNCGHTKELQEKVYKSSGTIYVGGGSGRGFGGGSFGGGFGGGSFGGGGAGSRF